MPKLSFSRIVPHTPKEMLNLVAEVARYPEFVPNCTGMEVTPGSGDPGSVCNARMWVSFGPINQAYTSRVVVDRQNMTVTASAIDGPFSHLESLWRFEPEGEGARIFFDIDFKFKNLLLAAVIEQAFAAKQEEIVDAFVLRAAEIYG